MTIEDVVKGYHRSTLFPDTPASEEPRRRHELVVNTNAVNTVSHQLLHAEAVIASSPGQKEAKLLVEQRIEL